MTKESESGFWEKYGIIIIVFVFVFLIVISVNMLTLFDFFKTEKNAGNSVLLKAGQSGYSVLSSVSRETLNREAIITLTNNARAQSGLPPLKENQLLNSIAESRAQDMLDKQYFAHVSPTGQAAADIAQNIGYHYKVIAENIGSGDFYTNQKIVDNWMQSPGHRMNILSTEVEDIGAAVLKGNMKGVETYITVQVFGLQSPLVSEHMCVAPSKSLLNDIDLKKAEIETLRDQLHRLKNEIDAENESIDTDRKYASDDNQKIQKLNERIRALNEKSLWYNKTLEDEKAKSSIIGSMIDEYNKSLQTYNDCRASH
ncbi:MAG TPA: CAP domain-containing protein [Smithella sp.]|nr:CAP domain-containing protein [Smithella sp.]